jgi:hypothetical protein
MGSSNNATVGSVSLEHAWVEAAIDYLPSSGRHMVEADTWIALDASFKQYIYLQELDAIEIAELDVGEITDLDQLPQTLPGHSISFTPEIKLNGEIILTGPSSVDGFTLETMLAFEVQQLIGNTKWGIPFKTPVPKGSYLAIMANAGSVSTHALEAAQQRAEEAKYILENELEDQYD